MQCNRLERTLPSRVGDSDDIPSRIEEEQGNAVRYKDDQADPWHIGYHCIGCFDCVFVVCAAPAFHCLGYYCNRARMDLFGQSEAT